MAVRRTELQRLVRGAPEACWSSLRYCNLYRIAVAALFLALTIVYGDALNLGSHQLDFFRFVAAAYLVLGVVMHAVLRNLREGYAWGWDTDAGQIPARLAALAVFYQQHLGEIRAELAERYAGLRAEQPHLIGEVRTGLDCGALTPEDLTGTGLDPEQHSGWDAPTVNSVTRMPRLTATDIALPMPCRNRATMSMGAEPAAPASTEAAVNTATPATNMRDRPTRSPSRPLSRSRLPNATR
jgi:hypothetical protein